MKDNEIIKALECSSLNDIGGCRKIDALDLINRQKSEIEQWKEEANKYQNLWCEAVKDIQTAKSEAIKEFAEMLKEKALVPYGCLSVVCGCDIDNLVAEMTEDRENG